MIIQKVAVVGAGQMGSGIAQVAASSGLQVCLVDSFPSAISKAQTGIQKSLEKLTTKNLLKEKTTEVLARLSSADSVDSLKAFAPDLVIEAIVENFEEKAKLFKKLDALLEKNVIFASDTSSISITKIAGETQRPHAVVGVHLMNPVPLMPLVEMIAGLQSSPTVFDEICSLAEKMGKTVVKSKDQPGFIVNRILMPMINEAIFALGEGLGTAEDIDAGTKLGTNQPMGPLALADFIGLDTCLSIMKVLYEGFGDSKYRPAPLLQQYVDAGWLGRKTGRGIYSYSS